MKRISMGMLLAILKILQTIHEHKFHIKNDLFSYMQFSFVNLQQAIELAVKCNWLVSPKKNLFFITKKGLSIISKFNGTELTTDVLQTMLYAYALSCNPIWVFRVPRGRKEASLFMSIDEKRCFYEAGLLDENIDKACIKWWDSLSARITSTKDMRLLRIGRKAEQLTIQYEKNRTGVQPDWRSFDTNLVGYDVLSIVKKDDCSKLLIEVKASSLPMQNANMIISNHEWEVAMQSQNYVFHLWTLSGIPELAVIKVDDLKPHIPQNLGKGEWKKARIPFVVFKEFFNTF